jgi:hypothetical protein
MKADGARPRCIWLKLEAPEVIELKEIVLDRDAAGAAAFFQRVVAPRVLQAAQARGLEIEFNGVDAGGGGAENRDATATY